MTTPLDWNQAATTLFTFLFGGGSVKLLELAKSRNERLRADAEKAQAAIDKDRSVNEVAVAHDNREEATTKLLLQLSSRIVVCEGRNSVLEERNSVLETRCSALEGTSVTKDTRIKELESHVSTLENRIIELTSKLEKYQRGELPATPPAVSSE